MVTGVNSKVQKLSNCCMVDAGRKERIYLVLILQLYHTEVKS